MRALITAALVGLTLSACGGGGDAGRRIGMRDLQFVPREATVRVGQRVRWRNDEDAPHNVLTTHGARVRSKTIPRDGTFTFTPRRPGTIHYVCTLHPGMEGTLRVAQ